MNPDLWMCRWGSIDIDEGDESLSHRSQCVQMVLRAMDIQIAGWNSHAVRAATCGYSTGNGCGHRVMRRAMKAALGSWRDSKYDAVYPKQDSLKGPPGNYMRLPYGGKRPEHREVVATGPAALCWTQTTKGLDLFDFIILAEQGQDAYSGAGGVPQPCIRNHLSR